jgi:NADP-dependent 3-hydroxy acid dehydrogenase YdfG
MTTAEINALRDKVILVTGGASGLGKDVAMRASERGAKLVLLDIRQDRLDAMQSTLAAADTPCLTVQCDVANEGSVVNAITAATKHFGQIDVVVNSAGVYRGGPLVDMTTADYDLVFDINVKGTFLVSREAAKVMMARQKGHIINIASIGAKHVFPKEIVYAASKWAVIGLSEGMSVEFGPSGIRVTTVDPGGMNTTFWDEIRPTRPNWNPTAMLNSDRVAQVIIQIASLPEDVVVKEALVYPPGK